ncbi:RimK family protein [Hyphomonas chukchiensis]|uniref:Carboxylate--amine ligase n=1 Tax=Hyphomonas chukchiensis TaxID=1280947 RepID=A0A062UDC8_9PROT|nr:RimK family protein [Hyphomonas chukchiensis]KCZ54599.1 carboxylate--amine ligase [Hyphomonas chukchiensis]
MTDWVILVETASDISQAETPHKVLRVSDYISKPALFAGRRPYILNLSRSYAYQSEGYYASLLAEARGHRVSPSVQTMVELSAKGLYTHALPDLGERLREARTKGAPEITSLFVAFSKSEVPGYEKLAREVSDWFRTPALEVEFDETTPSGIARVRIVSPHKLKDTRRAFFLDAMATYTSGRVSAPKTKAPAKWSLAVLVDPKEQHAPSKPASIKRFADVAAKMGVEVELIEPSDLTSVAEFDALFIRATTSIDNFTYRFARRAEQEGMPVIDDTHSMIRCTNKVYLKEILEKAGLPIPRTEILDEKSDLIAAFARLGSPVILKTPDGSFGNHMVKATTLEELTTAVKGMFDDTALVIAQEFIPTKFDWRIGVLNGEPMYACQYRMARGHWQIIKHGPGGKTSEGGFTTLPIEDAPPEVVDVAVRAARLIGDGLYGVDLKETDNGVVIIEINDNPSIDHDVEGAVMKDEIWRRIISWFSTRLEQRMGRVN